MISLNDVLLAMSNIPVDDPIAEIWGRGLQGGYRIIEYTGSLPITIRANGDALLDYRIYGADGGVGERVDITGLSEPLCGIQTYTDSLDLSTGILTRRIKKLVLTGAETISSVTESTLDPGAYCFAYTYYDLNMEDIINCRRFMTDIPYPCYVSGHFKMKATPTTQVVRYMELYAGEVGPNAIEPFTYNRFIIFCVRGISTITDFKAWVAAQYAAGTPVTVWYILKNADVSTIPVPSGLTGTLEGYLIQDGTPTPETPIYPTANGVKQADGTYSIEYSYKLPMTVSDGNTEQTVPVYIGENQLDAGEYVSYGEQKIYRDVDGTLTPTDPPVSLTYIPTIDGITVIDYDGTPKPSQMYVKYKGKG